MKLLCIIFFNLLLMGCLENTRITKRKIGNKIVESSFLEDSIFHGVTKFYDLNGRIESKVSFNKGIKNGVGVNYHSNGNVHDSSIYENGYKTGDHYVFDSIGELIYTDYYLSGHQLGGQTFFKKGKPFQYIFHSFEKKKIFSCAYDSIGMFAYNGEVITLNIYTTTVNNVRKYGLFVYFLNPPYVKIDYSLALFQGDKRMQLCVFRNERVFVDTLLDAPPIGWKYYLSANYFDSLNNIKKIFLNPLEY